MQGRAPCRRCRLKVPSSYEKTPMVIQAVQKAPDARPQLNRGARNEAYSSCTSLLTRFEANKADGLFSSLPARHKKRAQPTALSLFRLALVLFLFFRYRGYAGYMLVRRDIHELHALRVPAYDRHVLHGYPYYLAGAGRYHELVRVPDLDYAGNRPVLLGYLDIDEPASAPALAPVLGELGPLAVAVIRDRKDRSVLLDR